MGSRSLTTAQFRPTPFLLFLNQHYQINTTFLLSLILLKPGQHLFEPISKSFHCSLGYKLHSVNRLRSLPNICSISVRISAIPMDVSKGLSSLGLMSGRGLDNGEYGAVMLANQVCTVTQDLEEKKRTFMRLQERQEQEGKGGVKSFKVANQTEKDKTDAKWKLSKVREELCQAHEAYQYFRAKQYGSCTPGPNKFL